MSGQPTREEPTTGADDLTPRVSTRRVGQRAASGPRVSAEAAERDYLLDRLHSLRTIMPVLAHELASARRQTAVLRLENRRLLERIQQLQREQGDAQRQERAR